MATKAKTMLTRTVTKGAGGTRLAVDKYEAVKKALLATVPKSKQGIAFKDLPKAVAKHLPKDMQPTRGSASWLTTVVKLDLEARGILERVPGAVPQRLRRVK